ncbi:MAG: signal transduction histidine kinase/CheY-like chemotaxis protein [Nitrospinales bacterium]|jgi:signal transduction histidine kinase/CheY-like chemotaxis protein
MKINLNIKAKIIMSSCLGLAMVVVLAFASRASINAVSNTNKQVEYTHQVLEHASKIEKLIVDMETGERGFLISGKEEFLEPYETGKRQLVDEVKKTKNLVSENPEQIKKLNEIEKLIDLWQAKAGTPEINKRKEVEQNSDALKNFEKLKIRTVGQDIFENIRHEFNTIFSEFKFGKQQKELIISLETFNSLLDMETGQRGFLLTGQEKSLEPFNKGLKVFQLRLNQLKTLSKKNKNSRVINRSIDRIELLVKQWLEKAVDPEIEARYLISVSSASISDVTSLIEQGTGQRIMDDLRTKIMIFKQVEQGLIATRKTKSDREILLTKSVIAFGSLVIIILSLFGSYWLASNIARPINSLKLASEDIGKGIYPGKIYIESKDEVADLGIAFEGMVEKIKSNEKEILLEKEESDRARRAAESARTQSEIAKEEADRARQAAESARTQSEIAKEEAEKAKKDAEKANQAKSIFLANMSHEIRTPLNAVLGYSQILKSDESLNEDQYEAVNTIDRSGNHLLQLINDILDISKIEAGKQELNEEDFDLGTLMNELKSIFSSRCNEKQLVLEMDKYPNGEYLVSGDMGKLRQILINLLGNAVKFTDTGSVECRFSKQTNNQFLFEVVDTGVGIPKDAQEHIFEPFQQDQEGLKKGGTGLGLAISRKQVTQMGGELKLISEQGKGSQFYFSLALERRMGSRPGFIKNQDSKYENVVGIKEEYKIKALVVDDIKENRDVLSLFLKKLGVDVAQAENGKVALEQIEKDQPHIIFMDIRMPIMDGVEALKEIKKIYPDKEIKVICITASTLQHQQDKYLEMGFDCYIGKPFQHSHILKSMETILKIEYNYKENTKTRTIQEMQEDIDWSKINIPPEIKTQILNDADCYSISGLQKSLDQLKEMENGGKELGGILKKLVKSYDMEEIVNIMKKIT